MPSWRNPPPSDPPPGSAGRPGPDGHHDDLAPDQIEQISVDIPDDASALSSDRELWLAEDALDADAAQALEVAQGGGPNPPPDEPFTTWRERRDARRRRLAITAAVVVVSMVVVALSGAIGALIVGPQASAPGAAPLASPAVSPGQVGGLLPADVLLQNGDATLTAQSLRPAVIAVIPPDCAECAELLTALAPQVGSFGVPLIAVGGPTQAEQLGELADAVGSTRLITLTDPSQRLRATYGTAGATLLMVRDDGVVVDAVRDPLPGVRLESALVELVPGVGSRAA